MTGYCTSLYSTLCTVILKQYLHSPDCSQLSSHLSGPYHKSKELRWWFVITLHIMASKFKDFCLQCFQSANFLPGTHLTTWKNRKELPCAKIFCVEKFNQCIAKALYYEQWHVFCVPCKCRKAFLVQSVSFVGVDWRQMILFEEHLNHID